MEVEAIVIGAGVVGLAIARALARTGREVVIVEAATAIGTETSSRSSEVIHAGIDYPAGSLKGDLCVRGKDEIYEYCAAHAVPHQRCGKLIVAADARDEGHLEHLARAARKNGVNDIELIDRHELSRLEPNLDGVAALLSPSTGIVDSHALMLAYLSDAERSGAKLALSTPGILCPRQRHG